MTLAACIVTAFDDFGGKPEASRFDSGVADAGPLLRLRAVAEHRERCRPELNGILAIGFLISELRVRSGSVFVPTLLHAVHNFVFQLVIPVAVLTP